MTKEIVRRNHIPRFRYWDGMKMVYDPALVGGLLWNIMGDYHINAFPLSSTGKFDVNNHEIFDADICQFVSPISGQVNIGEVYYEAKQAAWYSR